MASNTFAKILKAKIIIIVRIKAEFGDRCIKNLEEILRKNTEEQRQRLAYVPSRPIQSQHAHANAMDEEDYEEVEVEEE